MAVITISRQYGSGGREIAARICELLGYRYLDKLLMTQVAAEVGLSGQELADFSEEYPKVRNFLERLLRPGPHGVVRVSVRSRDLTGAETLSVKQLDESRCASLVRSAIQTAHKQEDVVIVGRGGQAILQEVPNVLHVRIEAPMGTRILQVQKRKGGNAEEARRLAIQQDQAAAQYLQRLFGIRWDNPILYHILINTGKWEPERAAQIIFNALGQLQANEVEI
ncbi:MAG: cytidylate kinase-like family protein [Anaerolineae bacterium]|jgi:cytidylate kinase